MQLIFFPNAIVGTFVELSSSLLFIFVLARRCAFFCTFFFSASGTQIIFFKTIRIVKKMITINTNKLINHYCYAFVV
ncbi:unknown [Euproctis pseudoconspersa nucleopolyhedrovirus]|uniref:Uncharacterized protein n=1 Tax=Euproctis pseudoconspersa nucleopolyhedrovirus TaxID=307467 RepID=C3TWT1_9ABAC|nr:hypothetical protein EupsNPV_gp023 [Euproctis pseudoconspersa nucleopolyhedrovirus]ACO53473.1 unknown [Euproctis pseudoconspersa nucleopolyhedrovirus]